MSKFKVMYIAHSLGIGGTEKLIYDMAEGMAERGIEPMVCCLDRLGVWGEELKKKGLKAFDLQRKAGIDTALIKKMRRIIKDERPDILNPHQYTPYFYTICSSFGLRDCPRIVFTEHGRFYPDKVRWKRVIFNQFANMLTDEIIGVSKFSKKALVDFEWFPAKRIKVIYNGIKAENYSRDIDVALKRRSIGLNPEDQVIGTVGRLCAEKNYKMLIRAFAEVAKEIKNAKLVIVGGGELEGELKNLTAQLRLSQSVLFLGFRQDVPELLRIFDIFALSSDSEGASLVLLEAMASGLSIVATKVGGNPELVVEGETGILVPRGDSYKFSEAIIDILRDPERKQKLGGLGRQRVFEEFNFRKMVDEYIGLYEKLLKK